MDIVLLIITFLFSSIYIAVKLIIENMSNFHTVKKATPEKLHKPAKPIKIKIAELNPDGKY